MEMLLSAEPEKLTTSNVGNLQTKESVVIPLEEKSINSTLFKKREVKIPAQENLPVLKLPQQIPSQQNLPVLKLPQQIPSQQNLPVLKLPQQIPAQQNLPVLKLPQEIPPQQNLPVLKLPQEIPPQQIPSQQIPPQQIPPQQIPPQKVPYFPIIKVGNNKKPPYSEVVKCLESLDYVIQITEEEYNLMKSSKKIPALCPLKHGIAIVTLSKLAKGMTCCDKCGVIKRSEKRAKKFGPPKIRQSYEEKTGYKHPMQNPEFRKKREENYEKKTGYIHPMQNPEFRKKKEENYEKKTGYKNPFENPEVNRKMVEKYEKKTGYKYPSQNPEVLRKREENYEKKTGYKSPLQNPEVLRKREENYEKKTGYKFPMQNPDVLRKSKENYEQKSGYEYPSQNPEVRKKIVDNYFKKTGYNFPSQNPEVFSKIISSSYKSKIYVYPSGRETTVQGYEAFCLNELLKLGIDEKDICNEIIQINDIAKMPEIWYNFENRKRRYFPDIFIISQNKIIEVKSTYTFNKDKEKNLAKGEACKKAGYNFEFRIYNEKGILLEQIIL